MNAKVCKQLRRAAERASIGRPGRRLLKKPIAHGQGRNDFAAINDPNTTRGIYRAMKRAVKRA